MPERDRQIRYRALYRQVAERFGRLGVEANDISIVLHDLGFKVDV